MSIVNLTPHAITFVSDNGNVVLVVPPSGQVARVTASTVVAGYATESVSGSVTLLEESLDGDLCIPVTETVYGDVEGLPDPESGTIYVVSSLVAQRCKGREDVFIPNESVRDSEGRIVGCKSLGRI